MAKKTIKATKVGKKITMVIEDETLTKSFPTAAERKEVLDLVEAFNKRNSKAKEAGIRKLMAKRSRAKMNKDAKEAKELQRQAQKKTTEKKVDTATEQKAKVEKLAVAKVATTTTRRRYGGEY
jgi:hypothetical protein